MQHYREGAIEIEIGDAFFRQSSRVARDISVLMAFMQVKSAQKSNKTLRWLDLMSGTGIRALRWTLEACQDANIRTTLGKSLNLWVNDADVDLESLLNRNFLPLRPLGISYQISNDYADSLLSRAYSEKFFFDLIDIDCFGSPNYLIGSALKVLTFEGVLMLSSTDGRSPTGHERKAAIRNFAAASRTHPASWEMALRHQLAVIAREAWMRGFGLEPLISLSDGKIFRVFVRLKRKSSFEEERNLGLIARCTKCGEQASQSLLSLRDWPLCNCAYEKPQWSVSGPIWLGSIQSKVVISQLLQLANIINKSISINCLKTLQKLSLDEGSKGFCWSTSELAKLLGLSKQPSLAQLISALEAKGFQACRSAVMPGQLRTNASIKDLLRISSAMGL